MRIKNHILVGLTIALWSISPSLFSPPANAQMIAPEPERSQGMGNWVNYPAGTQIRSNGTIAPPGSRTISPSATIQHSDGSTTFYYPNGTRLRIESDRLSPSGAYLSPGSNGGLSNSTPSNSGNFQRTW